MAARVRITVAVEADRYSYRQAGIERELELDGALAGEAVVLAAAMQVVTRYVGETLAEHAAKVAEDQAKVAGEIPENELPVLAGNR